MVEQDVDELRNAIDNLFKDVTGAAAEEVKRISAGVNAATPPIAEENAGSIIIEAIGWHFLTMFISAAESIMVAAHKRGEPVSDVHEKIKAYAKDLSSFMVERLERARERALSAPDIGKDGNGSKG